MMQQNRTDNQYQPRQLSCRGVRGATTVQSNDEKEILAATRELLQTMMLYNDMKADDIASIFFTTSLDLNATYPALAARQIGLIDTALLCGHEMAVPDGLPNCIRIMIHWNTIKTQHEVVNVYLREAAVLRPDRESVPTVRPKQMDPIAAMVKVLENSVR